MYRSRQDQRRRDFKKGIDGEGFRRQREEKSIQIRKNKRDDNLLKKRNIGVERNDTRVQNDSLSKKLEILPELVNHINSIDPNLQLEATIHFRKLLSIEKNPPIEEVIKAGVVPRLIHFLTLEDNPSLQFEAAWALTNIASGSSDQTRVVIDLGAVPIFVKLLLSQNEDVREQAVWALGNIAGDSPQYRDLVLKNNALSPLLTQFHQSSKLSMIRNATWTLSNFCRGKPQPEFSLVSPALHTLKRIIQEHQDEEVVTDACWALSYLSDGPNEKIQSVIETEVCPRMVELLLHPSVSVQTPALRTVGNIVTGDDSQTQVIINAGALRCLLSLLKSPKKGIRKEACWTISNITAGCQSQIQNVIDAGIIRPLIDLLTNAEFDIKKEAAWAISNATSGGTPEQIKCLVSHGCIKPLCDLLICPDPRIVSVALEALENLLKIGYSETLPINLYAASIEEADGLEKIEQLQEHENDDISRKATQILENYLGGQEDDETVIPSVDPGRQAFNFGSNAQIPPTGFNF